MQIIVHAQHLDLSPATREYIEKKLSKLSRYFENIGEVEVHTSSQRGFKTAEVTVNANGRLIRAEERSGDFHSAIDLVWEKLETQIKHYKERSLDLSRRPHRHGTAAGEDRKRTDQAHEPSPEGVESTEQIGPDPIIVRRKQFSLEMMSAEEAAERMQMLGHDFFLYMNDETHLINVIYERREGGFGVLEPLVEAA